MSNYETDPLKILVMSDDEWDALILATWNAPLPRTVVRVPDRLPSRKEVIEGMLAQGLKRKDVSERLGLGHSIISLILSGKRA